MENAEAPLDIFAAVRSLGLPDDRYLVFGSGPMTAHGLRQSKDVDLLVTPALFEDLKSRGWAADVVEIEGRPRERVSQGLFEAFREFWVAGKDYDVDALIQNAEVIEGIRFMRLADLIDLKRAMGRDKDKRDIALIEEYLAKVTGKA